MGEAGAITILEPLRGSGAGWVATSYLQFLNLYEVRGVVFFTSDVTILEPLRGSDGMTILRPVMEG